MLVLLLTAGLLVSEAAAPKPQVAQWPYDVYAVSGKVLVGGKDFEATAHRIAISPDGKRLELLGKDGDPVILTHRPKGQTSVHRWSGQRIVFSPADGTLMVDGPGGLTEVKFREK